MRRSRTLFEPPLRILLDDGLEAFRKALGERKLYENKENLDRACNGARDFVDFLLEGPGVLRKWRQRQRRDS